MKFSIIVVALNPGEKLGETLKSVLGQTCGDFEIILKDGGSTDGSMEPWRDADPRIRYFNEPDRGIYDAMNQAVAYASGEFILFLNSGDLFADNSVLERTARVIDGLAQTQGTSGGASQAQESGAPGGVSQPLRRVVLYGDTIGEKNGVAIASAPRITGFTCYRNIPCHQSCFYSAELCREKPYDLQYKIRADYDHFLWCFYRAGAQFRHLSFAVASYEGGGFSESKANRKRDKEEHRAITASYMTAGERLRYQTALALTLAPLRRFMAENRALSGMYHRLKTNVYTRKKWFLAALVFFLLEMLLFAGPQGWARGDCANYLVGENSWRLQGNYEEQNVCQIFSPQYEQLESIGIVISTDEELSDGGFTVTITDWNETQIFETYISYDQIESDVYFDIETNLKLSPGKEYALSVRLEETNDGKEPALKVCGSGGLRENRILIFEEETEDLQLLCRYSYSNVLSFGKLIKLLLLCGGTSILIAFSMPKSRLFRGILGGIVLILLPPVLGARLELLTLYGGFLLPFAMKWNVGLMYAVELVLLLCSGSIAITALVVDLMITVLYSANYFVYSFRGNPLRIGDISAIQTAAQVVGKYALVPNEHLAMAWCIAVFLGVLACKTRIGRRHTFSVRRFIARILCFSLGCGILLVGGHQLFYTDFLVDHGFSNLHGFDQLLTYQFDGYLVGSCLDIQNSRIEKPTGYSEEKVSEILGQYKDETQEQDEQNQPHIILIMNESFSDLRVLGNLELSEENMPFFSELKENTVRGYTNVSVLGGGTANSEFEALTGCTMAFLPSSYYTYQQGISEPKDSLVSVLQKNGYHTYSIHPESKGNWNRERVYQYLGFEESLWKDNFVDAQMIHAGVSDLETYKKVEQLFEERKQGERLFVFDLTMQNHGGYTRQSVETDYHISALNADCAEAGLYLSLIRESDEAFSSLIRYFEQQEERVVICMFGDHQPKFDDNAFYEDIYNVTDGLTREKILFNQYRTPFLIWANYDIEERENVEISANYLAPLLLQTAGVRGSAFFRYLSELMEEYPVITQNGYIDQRGEIHEWSGTKQELLPYRMLQYNFLFDDESIGWGFR